MNSFKEKYKLYSNYELFRIIDSRQGYVLDAFVAATEEFNKRQVSELEIEKFKKNISAEREDKENNRRAKAEQASRVKGMLINSLRKVNPFQKKISSLERRVAGIGLFFLLVVINNWFEGYELILPMFEENVNDWDLSNWMFCLQMFGLPLGLFLFLKEIKVGWSILTFYLILGGVSKLLLLISVIGYSTQDTPGFINIFPMPSIFPIVLSLLIYLFIIRVMNKDEFLSIYSLDKVKARKVLIICTAIVVLGNLLMPSSL